ncbi:MAG TPA: FAD:protein FMN transferase [Gammaproteobacteria bacterium]|nr:FAD:protein FMN transferase [Gammaproteobacteria bacterium]
MISLHLSRNRAIFSVLTVACLLLAACSRPPIPVHQTQVLAFGTLVDITIAGTDKASAGEATAAVIHLLNTLHRRWHAWEPSPVTALNAQLARGEPATVDADMAAVIRRARKLAEQSGGLFNPAIGRLLQLWGFQQDERPEEMPPPAEEEITAWLATHPSMADLTLDGATVSSRNPAVQLDFGAFIKGYGVDLALAELKRRGIDNAIINAGGDLRAMGVRGDRPWRVGIRDPRGPGVLASLEIQGDEAVFTSGDYERYFIHEGLRYHHILDPRSGRPARGTTSVTVVHTSGTEADAAATALFIAGPARWRETAKALGLRQVMLIDDRGTVHVSPELAARLRFETEKPPRLKVEAIQ